MVKNEKKKRKIVKKIQFSAHSFFEFEHWKWVYYRNERNIFPEQSTTTSAIDFISFMHNAISLRRPVDVVYTDISKSFDSIDGSLIYVLDRLGVGETHLTRLRFYISESVQFVNIFGDIQTI